MNELILLIPHYNNLNGLVNSIQSIESVEELDILIVDDGSKILIDEFKIRSAFKAKGNIKFIYLESNQGIENALNTGLQYILKTDYKYIARLDCGDKCLGLRFKKQISYLKQYPEIKLIGCSVVAFDTSGKFMYNINMPKNYDEIKKKMFINCMFIHPTVVFTKDVLHKIGFYPTKYKYAEDYAYFFKIIKNFRACNIPEYLVEIEINPNGISISKRSQQVLSRIKIILNNFYFGYYPLYGLLRNLLLLIIPNKIIIYLKTLTR